MCKKFQIIIKYQHFSKIQKSTCVKKKEGVKKNKVMTTEILNHYVYAFTPVLYISYIYYRQKSFYYIIYQNILLYEKISKFI